MDRNTPTKNPMISVNESLSARRAWIEINSRLVLILLLMLVSLSARRAWIEINCDGRRFDFGRTSLSARRAWIEIQPAGLFIFACLVALRKESVDRNCITA